MKKSEQIIKVSSSSSVSTLSGCIVSSIEEGSEVELRTMGAGALNQAVKAYIKARGILSTHGSDTYLLPGFISVKENGEERTVISLKVMM